MSKETFTLAVAIKAHGQELNELQLRRPTAEECRAIKVLPYTLSDSSMPVADIEAACKYIAVCAGIPAGSVNQLDLSDLNSLVWKIIGFFLQSASVASPT